MKIKSPFRYPGGKTRLATRITAEFTWFETVSDRTYVEPFIGGGSSLCGFINRFGLPKRIVVNDKDAGVAAVWKCVADPSNSALLADRMRAIDGWTDRQMLDEHARFRGWASTGNVVDDAFATLYLNRTSFSGNLMSGPMGGYEQKSPRNNIRCRCNGTNLGSIIMNLHGTIGHVLEAHAEDFADVLKREDNPDTLIYLDPPYFEMGKGLYRRYDHSDHERLQQVLTGIENADILLSYDDHPRIHELYRHAIRDRIGANYCVTAHRACSVRKQELLIQFRRAVTESDAHAALRRTNPAAAQAWDDELLKTILERYAIREKTRHEAEHPFKKSA